MAYDGNQRMFLRILRIEDELSDHHREQGKMYSSREGYHSFSNKIERTVPCYKYVACTRIPGLGMNLLYMSQLQGKGYDVYFIKEKVYVKRSSWKKKAQIGIKSNRLYRLQIESPMALIGSHGDKDLNELRHRRMGHLHHGALRILRSTVTGVMDLSIERDDVCRGCAVGKYAKETFPGSKHRAKSVLGLIRSDICGPMSVKVLSGAEYFLTFIDDHSRKTWIYFLKTKDKVFC